METKKQVETKDARTRTMHSAISFSSLLLQLGCRLLCAQKFYSSLVILMMATTVEWENSCRGVDKDFLGEVRQLRDWTMHEEQDEW